MSQRIPFCKKESAPEAAKPLLDTVESVFGKVIGIMGTTANSPVALKALLQFAGTMGESGLDAKTQEAIALMVGQYHDCDYCLAAHTAKAKMTGAAVEETLAWRKGEDEDPKRQAILAFAKTIVEQRGHVSDEAFAAATDAKISDAEKLEVLAFVVLNTFTNYINHLCHTDIDFPAAPEA